MQNALRQCSSNKHLFGCIFWKLWVMYLVVWDFSSDCSVELICCCPAGLCHQTAGGEGKRGCRRDSRSLEGAPTGTVFSWGHPICTGRCCCLSLSAVPVCTAVLPPSSPLAPCQHVPVPAWSKAKMWVPLPPSGTYLAVGDHGNNHGIPFCPRLPTHDSTDIRCLYHGECWKYRWFAATALSRSFGKIMP